MVVDIQTVSIMLASASVIAGVIYYAFQVRHQTKVRQTDLVMRLYGVYGSNEFQRATWKMYSLDFKDWADYMRKYGSDIEAFASWSSVASLYESVGVLVERKLVDIDLVYDLFFTDPVSIWEKMGPIVKEKREQTGRPQIWEYFEHLYNELKKREQQLQQSSAKVE